MKVSLIRSSRGLLSGFFFCLYGLFALPVAVLVPFVPRVVGRWAVRFLYQVFVVCAKATGLFTVHVSGEVPPSGAQGRIVVMNHISLIDICVLLAHLPDAICIVKAAAKKNPFLSVVVKKLFITNDQDGAQTLEDAKAYLRRGVNLVVFPQGTRGGAKLHRGAARLALAAGADILAYRIAYDPVVLAKGQPWWDVGAKIIRISLTCCGVIPVAGANDHHNAVRITNQIRDAILPNDLKVQLSVISYLGT